MDEQRFWDLVGTIGPDPADIDRLTDQLSDHGAADICDFADHLARALYALDTPAHYRAASTTPERFVDIRCAAVAAGATVYRRILRSPDMLAAYASTGAALLPVAARAYETSTRGAWRHEPPVRHETGSNADAWGSHWLHPHMGTTTRDGRPQAYMVALRHVAVTLDADPDWQAWWRQGGVSDCELGIVAEGRLDHLRPSADIRRAGAEVRANFTCSPPRYDGRPTDLFPLAITEITGMFEVIREAIGLPPLPPVPPLPALPDDARELEITTKSLPAVPREVDQQGYLTLAQIQEFFG
jgi:hypothetical protein